ncbi:hypothetical protein [Acinetobacter lwoffii]|uniref:hypothetical protein n=1 Tax=Acinetobacter lwoffii TaxID=28090 RepID=UPI0002CE1441|nr:hypothetical protein [Acinetobacter lwoffii]ENU62529.1 hypothetical protein F980_01855 [Acinetobacter lwoffii NIPH 715]
MNTKVDEGKLISGKEALIALANGQEIEARHKQTGMGWSNAMTLNLFSFHSSLFEFRLKPRTITINGTEVPKSSDTYSGGLIWILCGTDTREYTSLALDENDELPAYFWRTEEEIKQVVAALRQVFGGSHDN